MYNLLRGIEFMPLKKDEKEIIIRAAKEYGLKRVWLFGSALSEEEYNDIDIGVEGAPSDKFMKFCGKVFWELTKEVDIIDMDGKDPMRHIIKDRGKVIYECRGRKVSQRTSQTHKTNSRAAAKT